MIKPRKNSAEKTKRNRNKKVNLLLIAIVVMAGIHFLTAPEKALIQEGVDRSTEVQKLNQANVHVSNSIKGGAVDSNQSASMSLKIKVKEKRMSEGKTISSVKAGSGIGEIGITEEGGGVGPTSFSITDNGVVLVLDRMNDRILSGEDGNLDTLIDLKGKFLKGMTTDENGDLRVLTGNDTLVLESFSQDGQKLEGVSPTFKPVHLNGMDIRKVGDELLISGAVENYSVNGEGVINELPGVPLKSDLALERASFLETSASEKGDAILLTFRNEDSAPVAQKEIKGDFGGILGTFPTKSGNTVMAVESMGGSPSISFITLNPQGEVVDHLEVADKGEYLVDQKTQVSGDGCKAFQMSAGKEKVEIIEYDLKCM
jgi:hypothetical protein